MSEKHGTGNRQLKREMKGDDIAERLLELGTAVIRQASRLPKDFAGRHIAAQVIRSGTSGGANYEEARAAESRADFIHKIGLAAKEVRETIFWLRLIERSTIAAGSTAATVDEARELVAILRASAQTARANSNR